MRGRPRAAARALRGRIEGGQRAAIVFGPERAGLSSDDVALADEVLTLPVNPYMTQEDVQNVVGALADVIKACRTGGSGNAN